jgi:hypothetical protein
MSTDESAWWPIPIYISPDGEHMALTKLGEDWRRYDVAPIGHVPDLMGVAEVAIALHIPTSNIDNVAGLPEPRKRVRAGRLWLADEIRPFAKEYLKRRRAKLNRDRAAERRSRAA